MSIAIRSIGAFLLICLPAACGGDGAQDGRTPAQEPTPQQEPAPQQDRAPAEQLVWLSDPARARALLESIQAAERHGLDPEDYGFTRLSQGLAALNRGAALSPEQRSALDTAFTEAFQSLARDLATGRIAPKSVDASWHISPVSPDLDAVLDQALRHNDVAGTLAALAPQQQEYARLMESLQRYRNIAAAGGWPQIPGGSSLTLGRANDPARVHVLRQRLAAEGYLPQPVASPTDSAISAIPALPADSYDSALAEAVRQFQASRGLLVDGIVGAGTLRALNVPAQERAQQIALNMERWRWLPSSLGDPHIRVNIAAYQLDVYEGERRVMNMPVIVGKEGWSTPFFNDAIDHVMLNPNWDVPRSIAIEDILPKVREDPSYLYENNFVVLDGWDEDATRIDPATIDWYAVSAEDFPYRFRQLPGSDNALGRIKFMFPNQFAVYLHDTPDEHLFESRQRALSHGCIRVARPLDLADYLFRDDPAWDRARFAQAIASGRHMRVDLPAPVPVYLLYWTAFVDDQGRMQLRPDIYGVDEAQSRALTKREGA